MIDLSGISFFRHSGMVGLAADLPSPQPLAKKSLVSLGRGAAGCSAIIEDRWGPSFRASTFLRQGIDFSCSQGANGPMMIVSKGNGARFIRGTDDT